MEHQRVAMVAVVLFAVFFLWGIGSEAMPPLEWSQGSNAAYPPESKSPQINDFGQRIQNVGLLALRVSNVGVFGANWSSPLSYRRAPFPSGEWPAGSGNDYLWAAGLWVGAVTSDDDTLVTAAVYQGEFFANPSPLDYIRESAEGMSGGTPGNAACSEGDDDDDGLCDEDFLDGIDNDGDGLVDEDYAGFSQQMFASVYYDSVSWINDFITNPEDHHHPLNLRVEQSSYAWSQPSVDDFVGIDFKVTNIDTVRSLFNAYVGFMVDADCGPVSFGSSIARDDWSDYIEFDTVYTALGADPESLHISMAYMWDDPGGDDGANARGILGVMFLGHKTDPMGEFAPPRVGIHAYRNWSGSGEDPENDGYRYSYLMGNSHTGTTIDTKVPKADDWRFLVSAGPFAEIPPDSSVVFQVAFVAGQRNPTMDNYARNDPGEKRAFLGTLIENAIQAQRVYGRAEPHWRTSAPPPPPNLRIIPGDGYVALEWDDYPETVGDPFTGIMDFGGYQLWKNVGWDRTSPQPSTHQWMLMADISKDNLLSVSSGLHGIGKYRYIDSAVHNGFPYWYAISSYDTGEGQFDFRGRTVKMYGSYSQSYQMVYPHSTSHRTLEHVRVVPNPFRVDAEWDLAETDFEYSGRRICWINLPEKATIRIYSLTGDLVQTLEHDGSRSTTEACWNLITRNNQEMVSGMYLYHIECDLGTKIGKFAVIR